MSQQQTQQEIDTANEAAGMALVEQKWDEIRREHPAWYARYDDLMPDTTANRSEMAELWATAPTPWAAALIYGKFGLRLEISVHAGMPF
ncbi:hypothetical protein AB4142_05885 [Variovorax sp. 2RAF20]|uniref:hypothetical protein n=1 Tax=Variovorax sp. CF313 TaxID=1144315 RepID=UPI000271025A|nr:hypothetical protein [Variovorax sp. CF313]EJL76621.1 hypothetical protein PMI12_02384 [Variovorax sp. CF313]